MSKDRLISSEEIILPRSLSKTRQEDSLKVTDIEKSAIEDAVKRSSGNLSKAAGELGIGRTTLYRKMKKYGL
jgi:transcriptional regulator of acetoin/glycerol metabolism